MPPVGDGAGRGAGLPAFFAGAFFAGAFLAGAFAGAGFCAAFFTGAAAAFFAAPVVRPARGFAVPWEPLPDVREAMVVRLPV
jgi:hypothetical protein